MDGTERLLRDVPHESPPPEIVLGAVRVFRYRAIAIMLFAITAVISGTWLVPRLVVTPTTLERIALAKAENGSQPVFGEGEVGGVRLLFIEVIPEPDRAQAWAHVIAWNPSGREIALNIRMLTVDGTPVPETETGDAITYTSGANISAEDWSAFAIDPDAASLPEVSAEVEVLTFGTGGRRSLGVVRLRADGGGR
jgi:hypothetical protein